MEPAARLAGVRLRVVRIGIFIGDLSRIDNVDELIARGHAVASDGFASLWLPQVFDWDALIALALIAHAVPDIELGTAVIPTYPRHPILLAQQAISTQVVSRGRLALGIGLSHQFVIENMFGYSFEKPVRHMREYLTVLNALVHEGAVDFKGETIRASAALAIPGGSPFPILVAALGPQMLKLAGTMADGTITWVTGPATIANHTVPTIKAAAAAAGRPEPRIVVGLPICVTENEAAARERAARTFEIYGALPSYRAMLDREGAEGPADVAIVGDETAVREALAGVDAAGATDFLAAPFGNTEERERTNALLKSLL
jgi:F420-dependent oxidoreductase-like protein